MTRFVRVMLAVALLAVALPAQEKFVPVYVANTGASVNFMDGQASSLNSVLAKVADLGGRPTYAIGTAEFSLIKGPDGRVRTNTMSLRPGICQVAYQEKWWSAMVCTDAGILHFDAATLGTFTGAVAVPIDLLGYLTKGQHHGFITPIARQVDITSRQVKPVWGVQIGTAFGK